MKSITKPADLAINGAEPAFPHPLHVGKPNIGSQERFMKLAEEIFERGWLTNDGPEVQRLERKLAEFLGVKHCVAMCNGTTALEIVIRALDLTGAVIVPSYTFIATAQAAHWQGLDVAFAEINPATHNIDPESVQKLVTPNTSGIIGVHLWGRPAPIRELQEVADEYGLKLIFDAAHAFGSTYHGSKVGKFGDAEVFSFHATKFFNSFEGGAVTTQNDSLASKMRLMRNFGFAGPDDVIHPGINGKMTEICAAMGLVNFESLDGFIEVNRRNYFAYRDALDGKFGLKLLRFDEREINNYQYIVFSCDESAPFSRDQLLAMLTAENVLARKYFWPGCHRMSPFREIESHNIEAMPRTDGVSNRVIVMPTGASVTIADIGVLSMLIRQFHEHMIS